MVRSTGKKGSGSRRGWVDAMEELPWKCGYDEPYDTQVELELSIRVKRAKQREKLSLLANKDNISSKQKLGPGAPPPATGRLGRPLASSWPTHACLHESTGKDNTTCARLMPEALLKLLFHRTRELECPGCGLSRYYA
jgi:hypothetical protein